MSSARSALRIQAACVDGPACGKACSIIQIDVDPGELNRDHVADIAILGDAKIILAQMVAAAEKLDKSRLAPVEARLKDVDDMKKRWSDLSKPLRDL